MTTLTAAELQELESVISRRLGRRGDPKLLVRAYLDAMIRNAYYRKTSNAPVPTNLTTERSLLLVDVS